SDPKDGGTIYVEEVILNESVEVKARTLSNGIWSALTHAAFYVGTVPASSANLVISELHYHPLSDDEGEEFVELMNIGAEAVDLRGVSFDDGISKGLNGQYFNGVIDEVVFYDKALPESRLVEHFQSMNQSSLIANFQASKRGVETGDSSILSWELEDGVTTLSMDAGIGNLDAEDGMVTVSPTETTEFTLTASDGVVSESRTVTVEVGAIGPYQLNEILSANAGPVVDEDGDESDWIEIANLGGVIGDLEGWYLTDDPALLTKWQFPSLEIAGGGYGLLFASGKDRCRSDRKMIYGQKNRR
ncbi:lamin tail domain-containing protein, partial [Akkermansiaceae bacterium]|nr:lamin tail domain-containing protein [Akkermansiaceae bacterium]